ncbi:halocin C8-like domain-containing protein [Halomicrococcus gelatinilyticus]|uniref:halocin C8-like domain-containing protein n=1 Tax=Halomicrococcus gelatinilyticus TaxID=1702103 RepID=UPI002E10DA7C
MSETNGHDGLNRRKVLKSMATVGAVGVAGIGAAGGSQAKDADPDVEIEEISGKKKGKILATIQGSEEFKLVSKKMRDNGEAKIEPTPDVFKSFDQDDNAYYIASYVLDDGKPRKEITATTQDGVVSATGSVMSYSDGEPERVKQYIAEDESIRVDKAKINQDSIEPTGEFGTADYPDVCPYCKGAVPIACFIGCAGGVGAICAALSAAAPAGATCFGVIGKLCNTITRTGCSGNNAQTLCEMAGLCQ